VATPSPEGRGILCGDKVKPIEEILEIKKLTRPPITVKEAEEASRVVKEIEAWCRSQYAGEGLLLCTDYGDVTFQMNNGNLRLCFLDKPLINCSAKTRVDLLLPLFDWYSDQKAKA
jgi:hypothetical protein